MSKFTYPMSKLIYPIIHLESRLTSVTLPKSIYSADAIRQTIYKFSGEFHIIAQEEEDSYVVIFESKNNIPVSDIQIKDICNDFIDQQVRIDTEKQFGHIRDLIVEEAFKPVNQSK